MTAIVDTQTNEFEPNGHAPDARFIVVTVPRTPDPATEKYSGNIDDPVAAKSASEITAFQAAITDSQATSQLQRGLMAAMAALFKDVHGTFPNASQRSALRADFVTVWKTLAP